MVMRNSKPDLPLQVKPGLRDYVKPCLHNRGMTTTLGDRIRFARAHKQMTQAQIAAACGDDMSRNAVSNWENNKNEPTLSNLITVSRLTGAPLEWLISSDSELSDADWGSRGAAVTVSPAEPREGYLRLDLFDGGAGMGEGVSNQDYPEVIRTVQVAEWELRRKLGYLPRPGRIQIITGRGPSMRPKIEHGDVVMVDTDVTYFDGDDYYLINVDGESQIKMLQKRGDGLYAVSVNPDFPEWKVDQGSFIIAGKVMLGLSIRPL